MKVITAVQTNIELFNLLYSVTKWRNRRIVKVVPHYCHVLERHKMVYGYQFWQYKQIFVCGNFLRRANKYDCSKTDFLIEPFYGDE
jgi:hypothetical protein